MPNKTTVSKKPDVGDEAPISFGNITFTKAGVYEYDGKEQDPGDSGAAGVKYDTAARIITVTVTDDGSGKLKAAVTAVQGSRTFTNKYETADLPLDTACGVSVTKVLNGHDMAKDQFEFTIKAADKDSAEKLKIATEDGATFKNPAAAADGKVVTLFSGWV
ncbi:MAG: FctA domain-containing protein [Clostridia bacterium]